MCIKFEYIRRVVRGEIVKQSIGSLESKCLVASASSRFVTHCFATLHSFISCQILIRVSSTYGAKII
jgi:hypothetical protein